LTSFKEGDWDVILAIDIGNTRSVFGVYDGEKLERAWRVATDRSKTSDEYGMLITTFFEQAGLKIDEVSHVIVSCVVPPVLSSFVDMCRTYLGVEPMIVGPGIKTGLTINYENPKEVGADRIVNAVAACKLYGGPCIIVDFGTATTFCVINEKDEYVGGVIAPGIGISSEALFERASKLPRVEFAKPRSVIGRNTVVGIQSGLFYGFISQVDGIVKRIKRELGMDVQVIATGGFAEIIWNETDTIDIVNPNLTLEGLRLLHERNL
jgi:type III pantothenate kinase